MSVTAILSGIIGTSTVSLSFPNLPAGVNVQPVQPVALGVNQGTTANYFLYATSAATPGNATVTISGTLGSVAHTYQFPITINPAAPFHLSVSPSQLSLTPGSPASVQVTVVPSAGAVPPVSLATFTLPDRWDFENPAFSGTVPGPFTLTFDPTVASQNLSNFPIFITATSNSGDTSTAILPANLTVPFSPITAPT